MDVNIKKKKLTAIIKKVSCTSVFNVAKKLKLNASKLAKHV